VSDIDRLDQPAGSRIVFDLLPNGLTLNVPPRIAWSTRAGLVLLSLFFAGLLLPGTLWALRNIAAAGRGARGLVYGWFADIALLLFAVCMGHRQTLFAVANGSLLVVEKGIFSSTRREWRQGEIEAVHVGPCSPKVKNSMMQLQIVPCAGKPLFLLTGRDHAELDWVAAILRRALSIEPTEGNGAVRSL